MVLLMFILSGEVSDYIIITCSFIQGPLSNLYDNFFVPLNLRHVIYFFSNMLLSSLVMFSI